MTHGGPSPIECPTCGKIHDRCRGHKGTGEPCAKYPRKGSAVCDAHGGAAPQVRARALVRAEVMAWGLTGHAELVDPGEILLRLVTQSAARVEMYSRILGEAYEAAERLRGIETVPQTDLLASETARLDFERVMNQGGVAALIGYRYAGTQTSGVIATQEAIRGLVELEGTERDRCANLAAKAVTAGLAERMVRASEQLAGLVARAVEDSLAELGFDAKDPRVRQVIAGRLASLAGPTKTIEGTVTA